MSRSSAKTPKPALERSPLATPDTHPLKVHAARGGAIGRKRDGVRFPYEQTLRAAAGPMSLQDIADACGCTYHAVVGWMSAMTPQRHAELVETVRLWPDHFAVVARELLGAVATRDTELRQLRTKTITCDGFFTHLGMSAPQPSQVTQIRSWIAKGYTVRMVTRYSQDLGRMLSVKAWCKTHIGCDLPVISQEDFEAGK